MNRSKDEAMLKIHNELKKRTKQNVEMKDGYIQTSYREKLKKFHINVKVSNNFPTIIISSVLDFKCPIEFTPVIDWYSGQFNSKAKDPMVKLCFNHHNGKISFISTILIYDRDAIDFIDEILYVTAKLRNISKKYYHTLWRLSAGVWNKDIRKLHQKMFSRYQDMVLQLMGCQGEEYYEDIM